MIMIDRSYHWCLMFDGIFLGWFRKIKARDRVCVTNENEHFLWSWANAIGVERAPQRQSAWFGLACTTSSNIFRVGKWWVIHWIRTRDSWDVSGVDPKFVNHSNHSNHSMILYALKTSILVWNLNITLKSSSRAPAWGLVFLGQTVKAWRPMFFHVTHT